MNKTPIANRKQVAIFGNTNSGKSTLFNQIIGQELAIVSDIQGTTTDPVKKAMELLPYGPILLVDTAGLSDISPLGEKRHEKTRDILDKTDAAILVFDGTEGEADKNLTESLDSRKIPYIIVISKSDLLSEEEKDTLTKKYPEALFFTNTDNLYATNIKNSLIELLSRSTKEDDSLIGGLLKEGSTVFMVIPIDSQAPKGRLILPQVQLIRDCLDHHIMVFAVKEDMLEKALIKYGYPDLVVTDSQIFPSVANILDDHIFLTSFSMLYARQKGDFWKFYDGCKVLESLKPGDNILIAEACSHNAGHEDIGTVKIPKMLEKRAGGPLNMDFSMGGGFPVDLEKYKLVVHCGGCMITSKAMAHRQIICEEIGVPMVNYGMLIAGASGILERCCEIFEQR